MTQIYTCTPRTMKKFVTEILYAGLVPFVQSSPGLGKSAIMHEIADEQSLQLIDHRLSTAAPEDLSGLPRFEGSKAVFSPFRDLFPTTDMKIPEGKQGWMLFLDEFNSAARSVQAAAYKLVLDRMTGQHKLHSNVCITAAGNLSTDRAITNNIGTAMQSRLVHIEMEASFEDWLYDVALKQNYDRRIIAYLSQYPSRLMDFRPDHDEKTFCCPRTWEFTNRLIQDKDLNDDKIPLLAGTITSGVAVDFVQFTRVFDKLIKVSEIRKNPKGCALPEDNASRWAAITTMNEHVDDDSFDDFATYANRFPIDFRILFFRAALVQHPKLREHPAFMQAMTELSKYLYD